MSSREINLLTLPSEIRLEILRYAMYDPGRDYLTPDSILVYWAPAFPKSTEKFMKSKPSYGTAKISDLLTLCRQLHVEIEEVLYSTFVFDFRAGFGIASVRGVIEPLSLRAKEVLREIRVPIRLDLGKNYEQEEKAAKDNIIKVQETREVFEYTRDTLSGLKRVQIDLDFSWGPVLDLLSRRRRDEFVDTIMGLAALFAARSEVIFRCQDRQKPRIQIMRVCEERLVQLKLSSKIK